DRRIPAAGMKSPWTLVAGPATWALHFLACYVLAAVWCAKMSRVASLGEARVALWALTAAALAVIAAFGRRGWRAHRRGRGALPHDGAGAGGRSRFLGFASLVLCGLRAVAVVYSALAIALIGDCRWACARSMRSPASRCWRCCGWVR